MGGGEIPASKHNAALVNSKLTPTSFFTDVLLLYPSSSGSQTGSKV